MTGMTLSLVLGMIASYYARVSAILALLASSLQADAGFGTCRQAPTAQSLFCGLPYTLSNFQGYYACNKNTQVGRPTSTEELLALIKGFDLVRGVGVGHSWFEQLFCAGNTTDSIDIVLTELTATKELNAAPWRGALDKWKITPLDPDFPIQVDEDGHTVVVQGGVQTRVLLDFLANYITTKSPLGWTLPAFPWYIDQTIAGAVATATHGSSLEYGTLSEQVLEIELALANGTLLTLSLQSNPHLFAAARVSVGRLGIITRLKFPIQPQMAVQRTVTISSMGEFVNEIMAVQENYKAALGAGSKSAVAKSAVREALAPLDDVQAFPFPISGEVYKVSYEKMLAKNLDTTQAQDLTHVVDTEAYYKSLTQDGTTTGPPKVPGAYAQMANLTLPGSIWVDYINTTGWDALGKALLIPLIAPGIYSARRSYLSQADYSSSFMSDLDPYDQYEVAFPLEIAGTCFSGLVDLWKSGANQGFLVPPLVRFVSEDSGYLSYTNGGPRMFVNLEDHLSHTTKTPNVQFERVMRYFLENCNATRMHWGKAGWPWLEPCYDGSIHYSNWCDFGCAVEELDPGGKFRSSSNLWSWRATMGGQDVLLSQCCTPTGFSSQCTCAPRLDTTGCPPEGAVLGIIAD